MHRRTFLYTATLAAAAPMGITAAAAQIATPAADDGGGLSARVNAVDPAALLEALLTTPVTTPLVPRDTPEVEPVPWEDESDTDLDGAVGGVLFQTGWEAGNNPKVMSTAIVAPDVDAAAATIAGVEPDTMQELYGLPFFVQDFGDYAIAVVQVGNLLLAGGAEAQDDSAAAISASPTAAIASGRLHLRALANLAATLDHLEDVLAILDA